MNTVIIRGAGPTAQIYTNSGTPGEHHVQAWGSLEILKIAPGNIGNSAVLTSSVGYDVVATARAYIYDILVSYTAQAGAPAPQVDVYNNVVGGTSYLTAPFTLSTIAAIGGVQTVSARFQQAFNLAAGHDPATDVFGMGMLNWENTYTYPRGSVFSVRASTAAAGTITALQVSVVLFMSNNKGFGADST